MDTKRTLTLTPAEEIIALHELVEVLTTRIFNLEQENKELEEENDLLQSDNEEQKDTIDELREDNESLFLQLNDLRAVFGE